MVNLERCAAGLRTTFVFRNQVCSKLTLMQKGVILEDDVPVASFHIFINLEICDGKKLHVLKTRVS